MASSQGAHNANPLPQQYHEPSFRHSSSNPPNSIANKVRKPSIQRGYVRITEGEYQQLKKDPFREVRTFFFSVTI